MGLRELTTLSLIIHSNWVGVSLSIELAYSIVDMHVACGLIQLVPLLCVGVESIHVIRSTI